MCANINLFMEMNEEEMEKYLQTFVTDVWHLLMQVCLSTDAGKHVLVFVVWVCATMHGPACMHLKHYGHLKQW